MKTTHLILIAFFATFYWQNTSEPVGPTIYGGATKDDCTSYAADLIRRIKRGQGKEYRPLDFRCDARVKS